MRIAQIAPLYESVPPHLYGGTERVISNLTEELVRQGHDVTLFASADSTTSAKLVSIVPRALRLAGCDDTIAPHICLLEEVFRRAPQDHARRERWRVDVISLSDTNGYGRVRRRAVPEDAG